jgi:hypothetical protein
MLIFLHWPLRVGCVWHCAGAASWLNEFDAASMRVHAYPRSKHYCQIVSVELGFVLSYRAGLQQLVSFFQSTDEQIPDVSWVLSLWYLSFAVKRR